MTDITQKVQGLLASAGIQVNGDRPWDMQVHNEELYRRVFRQGALGLGEAYMDRWWSARALDQFFFRILKMNLETKVTKKSSEAWAYVKSKVRNPQNQRRAYEVGDRHYDTGNDLFKAMLDKRMVYTCGYWLDVDTLDAAQERKLDMVCQKLGLKPGQRVLDIGCGWGSFAKYAAEEYGAEVVGLTVSREQVELAKERCKGLPVEIRLQDYRQVDELFDHVVSLGMFEHVGYRTTGRTWKWFPGA